MSRSRVRSALAILAALLVMGYAQLAIRRNPQNTLATTILLVAAVGAAVLVGRGATVSDDGDVLASSAGVEHTAGVLTWSLVIGGLALTVGGAVLLSVDWREWCAIGWGAILAGVCVAAFGLRRFDPPGAGSPRWTRVEVIALVAIVLIGTFLRFYRYADFPDAFTSHANEEPQTGYGGYRILHEGTRPWEFMLDWYAAALSIWLSTEPTFLTIRIPFTICSALTAVPVHLLLRQLVGLPAALAGTFLFSVSSWNIIYSRCAHNIFLTNFFVILVLAILVRFGRTRRLGAIPWAALSSGYALYAYAGYRGTVLFTLLFLGGLLIGDAWRSVRAADAVATTVAERLLRRDVAAIAVVLALVAAVAAPLVVELRADRGRPGYYLEAASRSLANKGYYTNDIGAFLYQRLERIEAAAQIFMHVGDRSETFNAPGEPMLDPITSIFFVGGLCLALCFPRRGFNAFFVFMFLFLMLGGTVFVQNLDVRRLQGTTVFIALFAALFLDGLWAQGKRWPAAARGMVVLVALALGAGALWWNYDVYFHKMAGNRKTRETMKNQYTTLIRYGREHRSDRDLLLISLVRRFFDKSYYYRSYYSWLIDPYMHGRDLGDLSEVLPQALPPNEHRLTVLIQRPYETDAIGQLLTQIYPGTHCHAFVEPDNPYIALNGCDLPDTPPARPLTMSLDARYWLGEPVGDPFLSRAEPFLGYAMVPEKCYQGNGTDFCSAEWTGTFTVPAEGDYVFHTETTGHATIQLRIDHQPLTSTPMHLTGGPHRVEANARMPREFETGARFEWLRNGKWEVVPFYTVGIHPDA